MKYTVLVKPNSRHRHEVVVQDDGSLMVYSRAPAVEGRANQAVISLLADYFSVPKSRVAIVRGVHGRRKLVEVRPQIE